MRPAYWALIAPMIFHWYSLQLTSEQWVDTVVVSCTLSKTSSAQLTETNSKSTTSGTRCLHTSSAKYCTADVFPVPVSPTSSRGSLLPTATAMRSSRAVAGRVKANWQVGWRCKLGSSDSFRCRVDRPTDTTPTALHVGGLGWHWVQ